MKAFFVLVGAALALNGVAQSVNTARLDSLTSAYEKAGYHGVILVAHGDSILYRDAYGMANFEKKKTSPLDDARLREIGKLLPARAFTCRAWPTITDPAPIPALRLQPERASRCDRNRHERISRIPPGSGFRSAVNPGRRTA